VALVTEPYTEQVKVWPEDGRHVLAQADDDTVLVYQAYRPSIGRYAVEHGAFGTLRLFSQAQNLGRL